MKFTSLKNFFTNFNCIKSAISSIWYSNNAKRLDKLADSKNLGFDYSVYLNKSLRSFRLTKSAFDIGLDSYRKKMQRNLLLSKHFIVYNCLDIKECLNNFKTTKSIFNMGLDSYKKKMQKILLFSKRFIVYNCLDIKECLSSFGTVKSIISCLNQKVYKRKLFNTIARAKQFIFYDHSGRRWKKIKLGLITASTLIVLLTVEFNFGLQVSPILPAYSSQSKLNSYIPINTPLARNTVGINNVDAYSITQPNSNGIFLKGHLNVYGYIDTSDSYLKSNISDNLDTSNNYLKTNVSDYIDSIDVLIPEWYELSYDKSFEVSIQEDIEAFSKEKNVPIMPSISNTFDRETDSSLLNQILDSEISRKKLITDLLSDIKAKKYIGININFQGLDIEHKDIFTTFISDLYKAFHSQGLDVTVMVPADNAAYDYGQLSKNADMIILMLYKSNILTPGPIAPLSWCSKVISTIPVPSEKLSVMFSNYCYNWINGSNQLDSFGSYWNAMNIAKKTKAQIFWDSENCEPYFRYLEGSNEHIVRFLDGVTFYNQFKISVQSNIHNIVIHLGTVDPTIWQVTSSINNKSNIILKNLLKIDCLESLVVKGYGEIMNIVSVSQAGQRSIQSTNKGFISSEKYISYPVPSLIEKRGYQNNKEVILTFDDGPHPVYTSKILDILKENNVKATFFMLGKNVALYPDIVKRVYTEGHEIGSHTFSHYSIGGSDSMRLKLEVNSTQRLIQQTTGHSTVLFRPPYITTFQISRPEVKSLYNVQLMGYTLLGTYIDSTDWKEHNSDDIVNNVFNNLRNGNIILLHDAGGNRSNTVKALPKIIKKLKENGYIFTTISQIEGKTDNALMPAIQKSEVRYMYSTEAFRTFTISVLKLFKIIILSSLILGVVRLILFIFISYRQRKRNSKTFETQNYTPYISVVIAAFNEEKVICRTIDSILRSNYQNFEIIIVDDGSTDKTADTVINTFYNKKKVKLICKENGGKVSALNLGIRGARGEIIVTLDADTVITPSAISLMVHHFADKNIGAVSGNVKVGNVCNLLTRCQYVEYVTGFNLEKRCLDELNCITVVPGAIGAWRKEALINAGGFVDDTLAEDTDLTLALLKQGYKVTIEDKSIGFTEAPQDLKSFIKQRHRWSYGILQSIWKHRHYLLSFKNKALSFIALPNMLLFQYIFQVLAPVTDILFLFGFFISPERIIAYYLLFLVMDLLSAYYAFYLENEKKALIFWTIIQKFVYRWYMSYIVLKSIITVCKGVILGWNKLRRMGNVRV